MTWPFSWPAKHVIGRTGNPYLTRWDLLGTRNKASFWPRLYLHRFHRSDSDAALHDHPWQFWSLILKGGYYERTKAGVKWIKPLSLIHRPIDWVHRIVLKKGTEGRVWTLVLTGSKRKEWGFLCPKSWTHWSTVVDREDRGLPGCE